MNETTSLSREGLIKTMHQVIMIARNRLENSKIDDKAKMSWSRIIIRAVHCANNILKDNEIEEIENRLTLLEMLRE